MSPDEIHCLDAALAGLPDVWPLLEAAQPDGADGRAFSIPQDRIAALAPLPDPPAALDRLRAARSAVAAVVAPTVSSRRLGRTCHRLDMLALLTAVIRALDHGDGELNAWLTGRDDRLLKRPGGAELLQAARKVVETIGLYPRSKECWLIEDVELWAGLDLSELVLDESVMFRACRFRGPLDLSDADLRADLMFTGCELLDGVLLDRARLGPFRLDLGGSNVRVIMSGTNARGALLWPRQVFQDVTIDFSGAALEGTFDFEKNGLGPVRFERTAFLGADTTRYDNYYFGLSSFFGSACFDGADLSAVAFSDARFHGPASFRRCRVNAAACFAYSEFHDSATFDESEFFQTHSIVVAGMNPSFAAPASFRRIRSTTPLRFDPSTTARVPISFAGAHFTDVVEFSLGEGSADFDFSGARFDGWVDFRLPADRTTLDLTGASFKIPPAFLGAGERSRRPRPA